MRPVVKSKVSNQPSYGHRSGVRQSRPGFGSQADGNKQLNTSNFLASNNSVLPLNSNSGVLDHGKPTGYKQ